MTYNFPSPAGYFYRKYGKVQTYPAMHDDIQNVLPNEIFMMSSAAYFSPYQAFPTATSFPCSKQLQKDLKMPIYINFTPFNESRQNVLLVQHYPARCRRCKAYLNKYDKITGNEYVCCICGRYNALPQHLLNQVDNALLQLRGDTYVQSELTDSIIDYSLIDPIYNPATCDRAGYKPYLINPGWITHCSANVLATQLNLLQHGNNRIYDSGKNIRYPTSQRLAGKQVRKGFYEYFRECGEQGAAAGEHAEPTTFVTVHIVIIPFSINSYYQGVFGAAIELLIEMATTKDHLAIVPLFQHNGQFFLFRNSGRFELLQLQADLLAGEALLPLPLEELAIMGAAAGDYAAVMTQHFASIVTAEKNYFYNAVNRSGEALLTAVSSLQRSGGIVTLLLTEYVSCGLGKTPYQVSLQLYGQTHHQNTKECQERVFYDNDSFYVRLADEAAMHNVSVNVIGLPFNQQNLGIAYLATLCAKTGGYLFYNRGAFYITDIEYTGNARFVQASLQRILACPATTCSITTRTSIGLYTNVGEYVRGSQKSKDELFGAVMKVSDVEWHCGQLLNGQSFTVGFQVDGAARDQQHFYVQLAVLYTSSVTYRRHARVLTLYVQSEYRPGLVFNKSNYYGIISAIARKAAHQYMNSYPGQFNPLSDMLAYKPVNDVNMYIETDKQGLRTDREPSATDNLKEKEVQNMLQYGKIQIYPSINDGGYKLDFIYNYKEQIYQYLIYVCAAFRYFCGDQVSDGRLLIAYTQQVLPLYTLSLQKYPFLRQQRQNNEGGVVTADMRVADALFYLSSDSLQICRELIPSIYNLTEYLSDETPEGLPIPYQAGSACLKDTFKQMYMVTTPQVFILHIGDYCPDDDLKYVVEGGNVAGQQVIYEFSNYKLNNLLRRLLHLYDYWGGVFISYRENSFTPQMRAMLIEDSSSKDKSYYDFLQDVNVSVQAR